MVASFSYHGIGQGQGIAADAAETAFTLRALKV